MHGSCGSHHSLPGWHRQARRRRPAMPLYDTIAPGAQGSALVLLPNGIMTEAKRFSFHFPFIFLRSHLSSHFSSHLVSSACLYACDPNSATCTAGSSACPTTCATGFFYSGGYCFRTQAPAFHGTRTSGLMRIRTMDSLPRWLGSLPNDDRQLCEQRVALDALLFIDLRCRAQRHRSNIDTVPILDLQLCRTCAHHALIAAFDPIRI